MNWNRSAWWSHVRWGRLSREAGAALFQGLRVRLTLWYCGVLGAALVLFGVALYFGTQHFLLAPVESDAQAHALVHEKDWRTNLLAQACPLLNPQGSQFGPFPGQG